MTTMELQFRQPRLSRPAVRGPRVATKGTFLHSCFDRIGAFLVLVALIDGTRNWRGQTE